MVSERLSEITLGDGLSAVYTIQASIKGEVLRHEATRETAKFVTYYNDASRGK